MWSTGELGRELSAWEKRCRAKDSAVVEGVKGVTRKRFELDM
jgi:hypothetical protein